MISLNFLFRIGIQPTHNIVIVSGGQQRDSAIRVHVSILPQTSLPSRLPQNIEQNSLCYTVRPCWLSILHIAECTWSKIIFKEKKGNCGVGFFGHLSGLFVYTSIRQSARWDSGATASVVGADPTQSQALFLTLLQGISLAQSSVLPAAPKASRYTALPCSAPAPSFPQPLIEAIPNE